MSDAPAIQQTDPAPEPVSARWSFPLPPWARPGNPPESARGRRVILLAALLAMANAFDLTFTLLARHHELFWETNPIARSIIGNVPTFLAFKIALTGFGLFVVLKFRRILLTEILAWATCAVYSTLVVIWWQFFAAL